MNHLLGSGCSLGIWLLGFMLVVRLCLGMLGGSSSMKVDRRCRSINSSVFFIPYDVMRSWSLIQLHFISPWQTHFHQCSTKFPEIGCEMFTNTMAQRATTISLSILVTVEMFNAMNSLSENESLLRLPVWKNMYLVMAIALSMALHFMILYVPFFTVSHLRLLQLLGHC